MNSRIIREHSKLNNVEKLLTNIISNFLIAIDQKMIPFDETVGEIYLKITFFVDIRGLLLIFLALATLMLGTS